MIEPVTQPIPLVGSRLGRPPLARAALSIVCAAALLALAGWMLGEGTRDDLFPPVLPDGPPVVITRYSGPWIAGAAGMALLAGLLLVTAASDLWRRRAMR